MIEPFSFVLASLALLATPGPTNTLLATSGAASGFRASLLLLAGELAGYLAAITILIAFLGPVLALLPGVGVALRAASGAYLLYAAWGLWCRTEEMLLGHGAVSWGQVFVTTLLNPKALIFAFTIIPFGASGEIGRAAPWIAFLAMLIVSVGAGWIAAGGALRTRLSGGGTRVCCRVGAAVLTAFAALISGTAIAGVWPV